MFGCEHATSSPPITRLNALSNWRGRGADGCDERPVFDECVFQLAGERSARRDDELRQAGTQGGKVSSSQTARKARRETVREGGRTDARKEGRKEERRGG